jgi:hypothetical protein
VLCSLGYRLHVQADLPTSNEHTMLKLTNVGESQSRYNEKIKIFLPEVIHIKPACSQSLTE